MSGTIVDATIIHAPNSTVGLSGECGHASRPYAWRGAQGVGDGGYQGQTAKIRETASQARDMTCRQVKDVKGEGDEQESRRNWSK